MCARTETSTSNNLTHLVAPGFWLPPPPTIPHPTPCCCCCCGCSTVAEADLKAHLRKCPKLLLAQREQVCVRDAGRGGLPVRGAGGAELHSMAT